MTNDIENYEIVNPNDETHITYEKKKLLSYKKQLEEYNNLLKKYNTLQDNEISLEKRHSQLEDDIALLKKQIQIETTNLEKITEGLNSNQSQILISQLSELEEKINKIHNIKIQEIEKEILGRHTDYEHVNNGWTGFMLGCVAAVGMSFILSITTLYSLMTIIGCFCVTVLSGTAIGVVSEILYRPFKKSLLKRYKKKEAKYYQQANELHQKVKLLSEQNKNIVTDLAILQEEQLDSVNKLSILAKEKEQKEAELIEVSEQIASEQRAIEFLHNKLLISQTYMLLETGETDSLEETETIEIKGRVKTLGEKQNKNY